ncbi:transport permease protein [Actinomycetes bacterium]|nr:transport permease protein [Actinomycetes bacterium]
MTSSWARTRAHTGWELRLLLRNGEQLLLVFIIPVVLVLALGLTSFMPGGIDSAISKVLTISILASCFTSLAIATGFERRSGALRFLATTPLTRAQLLMGKSLATAIVTLLSAIVVVLLGITLGWHPGGSWPLAVLIAVLGCFTFASWGLFLAGALRAEAVLAVANGVFLALLLFGGILIAPSELPEVLGVVIAFLPSAALADTFSLILIGPLNNLNLLLQPVAVLMVWGAAGAILARRFFRWE